MIVKYIDGADDVQRPQDGRRAFRRPSLITFLKNNYYYCTVCT